MTLFDVLHMILFDEGIAKLCMIGFTCGLVLAAIAAVAGAIDGIKKGIAKQKKR